MTRLQLGTNIALCVRGNLSQGDDLYEFLGGRASIDCEDPVEQILVRTTQEIFGQGKKACPGLSIHQDDTIPSSFRLDLSLWIGAEGGVLNWNQPSPTLQGWSELNSGASQNFGAGFLTEQGSDQPNVQAKCIRNLRKPASRSVQSNAFDRQNGGSYAQNEPRHRVTKRKNYHHHPSPVQSNRKRIAIKKDPQHGDMAPSPLPPRPSPSVATKITPTTHSTGYVHANTLLHPYSDPIGPDTTCEDGKMDNFLTPTISSASHNSLGDMGSSEIGPEIRDEEEERYMDLFAQFINDDHNPLASAEFNQSVPMVDFSAMECGREPPEMAGIKVEWGMVCDGDESTVSRMAGGTEIGARDSTQQTINSRHSKATEDISGSNEATNGVITQEGSKGRRPLPTGRRLGGMASTGGPSAAAPQRKSPSPPSSAIMTTGDDLSLLESVD